jgi:O-acetyl-ADP-ribose deacetylase (regulator of RNase III)
VKIVEGNLLKLASDGVFDVIIHGCNCQCVMGAGIAKSIKVRFPEAYEADCKTEKGSRNKLGTYSKALVGKLTIVNAYTQFHWKGGGIKVDYEAIRAVFRSIKRNFSGKKIGYPMIGAGLAGGDWKVIATIIDEELEGEDHTLVKFVP